MYKRRHNKGYSARDNLDDEMLLNKFEETGAENNYVKEEGENIDDIKNPGDLHKRYAWQTINDNTAESSTLTDDDHERNAKHSLYRLKRITGEHKKPYKEDMMIAFTDKDPRGTHNLPIYDRKFVESKFKAHYEKRKTDSSDLQTTEQHLSARQIGDIQQDIVRRVKGKRAIFTNERVNMATNRATSGKVSLRNDDTEFIPSELNTTMRNVRIYKNDRMAPVFNKTDHDTGTSIVNRNLAQYIKSRMNSQVASSDVDHFTGESKINKNKSTKQSIDLVIKAAENDLINPDRTLISMHKSGLQNEIKRPLTVDGDQIFTQQVVNINKSNFNIPVNRNVFSYLDTEKTDSNINRNVSLGKTDKSGSQLQRTIHDTQFSEPLAVHMVRRLNHTIADTTKFNPINDNDFGNEKVNANKLMKAKTIDTISAKFNEIDNFTDSKNVVNYKTHKPTIGSFITGRELGIEFNNVNYENINRQIKQITNHSPIIPTESHKKTENMERPRMASAGVPKSHGMRAMMNSIKLGN